MDEQGYVYCGRRATSCEGIEVYRNGKPFTPGPSLKVRNHSPDGFNWGYCGSGPAQLALALLLDALRSRRAAEIWYQQFKAQVVSCWGIEWTTTQAEILRWYQQARVENVCRKVREDDDQKEARGACAAEQSPPAARADAGD